MTQLAQHFCVGVGAIFLMRAILQILSLAAFCRSRFLGHIASHRCVECKSPAVRVGGGAFYLPSEVVKAPDSGTRRVVIDGNKL